MGNSSSHSVSETIKKNQEYISEMNKIKMDRWIQMHYQIKERELALEISRSRELFYWLGSFYTVTLAGIVSRYRTTQRSGVLAPVIPLSFVLAYYADLAYGSKVHRIRAEADMIMQRERDLLEWPRGLPTVSSIDEARTITELDLYSFMAVYLEALFIDF